MMAQEYNKQRHLKSKQKQSAAPYPAHIQVEERFRQGYKHNVNNQCDEQRKEHHHPDDTPRYGRLSYAPQTCANEKRAL